MATIRPLLGIRYNLERINNISKVVTPPYDIISPEEQEGYYQNHPNNIIRLIKGKELPEDNDRENRYTRASRLFKAWYEEGIFQKESAPAIYVYEQVFSLDNNTYSRLGFIANVKLEELKTGHIYPHEQTLSGPKEDRLNLIKACAADLDPVFSLYPEHTSENGSINEILKSCAKEIPAIHFVDEHGVKNLLWVIKDLDIINRIVDLMKDKPLFIADGHHRYETALIYRNHVRETTRKIYPDGDEKDLPSDYVLMMCVSMNDPGLKILPAHRLVRNIRDFDGEEIKNKLREMFDIAPLGNGCPVNYIAEKLKGYAHLHVFILYMGGENRFYFLKLKDEKVSNMTFNLEYPTWRHFDVGILHGIVFNEMLDIKHKSQKKESDIEYIKDAAEAISMVNRNECQLSFFLNPTRIEDVQMVANRREIMPPKATYFYPKLTTGLVINKF